MLYRGSIDGFTAEAFHERCDNKGPTISLFKLEHNGDCIGGYTEAQWSSDEKGSWKRDPCALVFSLSHQRSYKFINPEKAICCLSIWGPWFGGALCAVNEPFNGDNNCWSNPDRPEYERIGVASGGASDLTQTSTIRGDGFYPFTINELEVCEVAFE